MSGIDNYNFLIREALNEKVESKEIENMDFPMNRYVIMRFFDFGEGKISAIHGTEFLREHPKMLDYQLNVKVGDILETPRYGRLRPGHFIIGGDEYSELQNDMWEILEKVRVSYESEKIEKWIKN